MAAVISEPLFPISRLRTINLPIESDYEQFACALQGLGNSKVSLCAADEKMLVFQ
ncbi:hypothetical protein KIN20_016869 [Parelaphostrongylus tenuis]|uniref:Uncharacterized protein n=1 Tax=Parelaphostrongylus tenuis TaxID=148309 RepID=A0AAD5MH42_PARTN|nr:hypothetical protein KIN20_016869 [Parelaphostrongylus tenuis]